MWFYLQLFLLHKRCSCVLTFMSDILSLPKSFSNHTSQLSPCLSITLPSMPQVMLLWGLSAASWRHLVQGLYDFLSCHVMSCHVMSCHVMSCHVMSCHVMSCHVMSCHVCLSVCVYSGYIMHQYNGIWGTCAPAGRNMHHQGAICTMMHKGDYIFWKIQGTLMIFCAPSHKKIGAFVHHLSHCAPLLELCKFFLETPRWCERKTGFTSTFKPNLCKMVHKMSLVQFGRK